jgi:predicted aspartyl protease
MKFIALSLLLFLSSNVAIGQIKSETIPFFINKQSNICIKALINDRDSVVLMFHSASNGLTLLKEVIDKKVHLIADKSIQVESWGGNSSADFSNGNSLTIGKMRWDSLTIFLNENSGDQTDGKFGFDFFKNEIIEIDYDDQLLTIHKSIPKKVKNYFKLPFYIRNETIYLPASLHFENDIYRDTFILHTGYGGSVLLDPKIGEQYGMQAELPTISTSELRDSYNNIIKIETKELPEIRIGTKTVQKVPLSFANKSSNISMKVLGNDLLKRFNLIFDFKTNNLYLSENSLYKIPFSIK